MYQQESIEDLNKHFIKGHLSHPTCCCTATNSCDYCTTTCTSRKRPKADIFILYNDVAVKDNNATYANDRDWQSEPLSEE